ncbi:hypothetical protein [Sphingobium yanoikuyae]|uniref:Uncharacterized protein n=1 Tax=Sphingobium yanoikuyae TaxID=13690 RepID=A0A3G2V1G0_SPHYA|nr:hypothetical protein [Sphingobium yanoikuyae]AYO80142.1 hypothetical protein EBF16_26700 [Sphingobium yanoikuyae]
MADAVKLQPYNEAALAAAIAQLDDWFENGRLLDEVENDTEFCENIGAILHELKRLRVDDGEQEKRLRAYGALLDSAFDEYMRAEEDLPEFIAVDEYATEITLKDGSDWRITVRRSDDG